MTARGDVIFRAGQDGNDSDIWDDSALIKAYDNAVNIMKDKLADKDDIEGHHGSKEDSTHDKKHKKGRRRHRKKEKAKPKITWKAGDECLAVYSEDNMIYEAVIKSINYETDTCVVKYIGYGNEEEQILVDLLTHGAKLSRTDGETPSEAESMDVSASENTPRRHKSHRPKSVPSSGHHTPTSNPSYNSGFPFSGFNPFPGMPPSMPNMFRMMPPMFPSASQSPFANLPGVSTRLPHIPPPPPINAEEVENDEDSLYSMLISWYMSGYHTGYHQGLKQGKNAAKLKKNSDNDGSR